MTTPLLEARNLALRLGQREVLRAVSLGLASGDCVALLGLNGAGKTTLLRLLLGLLEPDGGDILLDSMPLQSHSRREIAKRMAYVPQAHIPSFPFTVREIVAMGRSPVAGWGIRRSVADEEAVEAALARLSLSPFADRSYAELSGGERQAVLIARSLAQGARIILMDEPSASLDLGQQTRLMSLLRQLAHEGCAILVSLHQPELAMRWFNRAVLLHDGQVLSDGPPQTTLTEQSLSSLYGIRAQLVEIEAARFLIASIDQDEG